MHYIDEETQADNSSVNGGEYASEDVVDEDEAEHAQTARGTNTQTASGVVANGGQEHDDEVMVDESGDDTTLKNREPGDIFKAIVKRYARELRTLVGQVKTSPSLQDRLEGIARIMEHKDTTETNMVLQHGHQKSLVTRAVKEVRRYRDSVKAVQGKMELAEHRVAFEHANIVAPMEKCVKRAEKAKDMLEALIADLKEDMSK